MAKPLIDQPLDSFVNQMHKAGFSVEFDKPETIDDLFCSKNSYAIDTLSRGSKSRIQKYLNEINVDGAVVIEERIIEMNREEARIECANDEGFLYRLDLTFVPYRLKLRQS